MDKLNGFGTDEIKKLIACVEEGKQRGKSLTAIFDEYAKESGRAKGSVRNFYYSLLSRAEKNKEIKRQFLGEESELKAGKIVEFRPEESRKLLKSILELKHGGRSVRSIIMQLAGGDDKKVLRYQNKYRNMIKNEKETVLGVVNEITALRGSCYNPYEDKDKKEIFASDFLFKRLQSEINSLYDRCTVSLKRENEKLKERLQAAEKENLQLKLSLERSISLNTTAYKIKEFFNKKDSKELIN